MVVVFSVMIVPAFLAQVALCADPSRYNCTSGIIKKRCKAVPAFGLFIIAEWHCSYFYVMENTMGSTKGIIF